MVLAKPYSRNIGIDLARIVAMVLVVLFHFFDWGGCHTGESVTLRAARIISWNCINIFALISGFVAIGKVWRLSRYLQLWIQVLVTGIVCGIVVSIVCGVSPTVTDLLRMILPVTSRYEFNFSVKMRTCFMSAKIILPEDENNVFEKLQASRTFLLM